MHRWAVQPVRRNKTRPARAILSSSCAIPFVWAIRLVVHLHTDFAPPKTPSLEGITYSVGRTGRVTPGMRAAPTGKHGRLNRENRSVRQKGLGPTKSVFLRS